MDCLTVRSACGYEGSNPVGVEFVLLTVAVNANVLESALGTAAHTGYSTCTCGSFAISFPRFYQTLAG